MANRVHRCGGPLPHRQRHARFRGLASNGYGDHSPGHYKLFAGFLVEVVMTMMFLFIIMVATRGQAPAGLTPLAIGLALTLTNLVAIPVTNASVNPARSTGPAVFVGGWALAQLWLVLGRADHRRRDRRHPLSLAQRTAQGAGRRRAGARGPRLNAPEPFFEEAPAYISQLWMFGLHPSSARRFLAWFAAGSMSPLWGFGHRI
jgi:hypothetical protein